MSPLWWGFEFHPSHVYVEKKLKFRRESHEMEGRNLYHMLFFDVLLEKSEEVPRIIEAFKKAVKKLEGVELVGLFFPRGSGYMYATITKYQDYATWEKLWKSPEVTPVREKANAIVTKQMDMFFDEITYAYPELQQ